VVFDDDVHVAEPPVGAEGTACARA